MAAAVSVSPHENDMVVQMWGFAQRMILVVGRTGSSAPTPEVLAFQQAWNRNGPIIDSLLKKLGSSARWFKLVEDGKYGPNTSKALWILLAGSGATKPPDRASGLPTWSVQNKDVVDALVPPSPTPVSTVLDDPMPIPQNGGAADAEAALRSSGSTVRNLVPVSNPAGSTSTAPPVVVSQTTSVVPPLVQPPTAEVLDSASPQTPADMITRQTMSAVEFDTGIEGEPIRIVTARPHSNVPWLAIGLGGVTLGGIMYWWTQRRKKRR